MQEKAPSYNENSTSADESPWAKLEEMPFNGQEIESETGNERDEQASFLAKVKEKENHGENIASPPDSLEEFITGEPIELPNNDVERLSLAGKEAYYKLLRLQSLMRGDKEEAESLFRRCEGLKVLQQEANEQYVAALPVLDWDSFMEESDEEKRAFIDSVREEFGNTGYGDFATLFNSETYWKSRWMHRSLSNGNKPEPKDRYHEPGTQPSYDMVRKELLRLGYQLNYAKMNKEQADRFHQWKHQVYQARAAKIR